MKRRIWSATVLLLLCANALAEVISKSDTGFSLKITADVPVTRREAYDQFTRIGEWWDARHSYFGEAANFSLQTRAGGCFCEIDGDKQVLHMLVTYVEPGVEIRMTGGLGPLQMMGVHGGMSWSFADLGNGTTRITQTYNVTGYAEGGLEHLASVVDRVQTGQLNRLVANLRGR